MPRQARLDAPGALHHVMGRGIEGISIFRSDEDREDFLTRLGTLCEGESLSVHAWALLDTHFHLLIRTGKQSISEGMRKLLTGYVLKFNRRYGRYGLLFQNRYKSILCEEDPHLLELTRYIHLNPVRAGVVKTIGGTAPGDDDVVSEPHGKSGGYDGSGRMGQIICVCTYVPVSTLW